MEIYDIYQEQKTFFAAKKTRDITFRKVALKKLEKVLIAHEQEVYAALQNDLGKPEYEAYLTEVFVIFAELKKMINNIGRWSKKRKVKSSLLNFPSRDYLIPEPYGCTLQISPWNYPFQLSLATLIGAVAAGNTVLLKPSEYAPHTSALLEKIIDEAFEPGHVKVLNGGVDVAQSLLALQWDHITFTGSSVVGKQIAKAAAEHLTPTLLELGGKNPCVVEASAKIQLSAKRIVWGKFLNCGQTCIAPDYLLVDQSIVGELEQALIKEIKQAFGEDASTSNSYGRIAHQKHYDRLSRMIEGEEVLYGGQHKSSSRYFSPTLIRVYTLDHAVMQEEIFGPILPILTYESVDEIEKIITHFERPLGAYVFSTNKKFMRDYAENYSYGGGVANDSIVQFVNDNLPFGGVGNSGMGSYHGKHSFDAYTHYKPFIERGHWIDPFLRYAPYPNSFQWLKKLSKYF